MTYLIQGLIIGFSYVMPIGNQNIFVINTALTQKRRRILLTALIVFFFDASLAIACFFGVGAIMSANRWLELAVLGIGSIVVIWIGFGIFRSKGSLEGGADVDIPVTRVITSACVVTWFNPQALIDGSMLLGASRAAMPGEQGLLFMAGVVSASFIWWFGMSTIVSLLQNIIGSKVLRAVNIVCGAVIMFYGMRLLWQFIQLARTMF